MVDCVCDMWCYDVMFSCVVAALDDMDLVVVVQTLITKCMENDNLCNEFYLQLIKQTTDSKSCGKTCLLISVHRYSPDDWMTWLCTFFLFFFLRLECFAAGKFLFFCLSLCSLLLHFVMDMCMLIVGSARDSFVAHLLGKGFSWPLRYLCVMCCWENIFMMLRWQLCWISGE